jgi:hypothetical protein
MLHPLIVRVAKKHKLKPIQITPGDEYCQANGEESYINKSYVAWPELYLGIYTDPDLHLASFFHEVGHVLLPSDFAKAVDYDRMAIEAECWRLGFELAKVHKTVFPPHVHQWAATQVETYRAGDSQ